MALRILRPSRLYGRDGRLGIGKTMFFRSIVYHDGGDPLIPGTNVPRLRLIRIGSKALGAVEDEVDGLIEGLRRERGRRDARGAAQQLCPPSTA